jgi:hypothetical protein
MVAAGHLYAAKALDVEEPFDLSFEYEKHKNDVRYIPLWDKICWFVFDQGTNVTPEEREEIARMLDGKVITTDSLMKAFITVRNDPRRRMPHLFNPQPEPESAPTPEQTRRQLENLDDKQLAQFRNRALRLRAQANGGIPPSPDQVEDLDADRRTSWSRDNDGFPSAI